MKLFSFRFILIFITILCFSLTSLPSKAEYYISSNCGGGCYQPVKRYYKARYVKKTVCKKQYVKVKRHYRHHARGCAVGAYAWPPPNPCCGCGQVPYEGPCSGHCYGFLYDQPEPANYIYDEDSWGFYGYGCGWGRYDRTTADDDPCVGPDLDYGY